MYVVMLNAAKTISDSDVVWLIGYSRSDRCFLIWRLRPCTVGSRDGCKYFFPIPVLRIGCFLQFQVIQLYNPIIASNLLPLAALLVLHTFENIPGPKSRLLYYPIVYIVGTF